MQTVLKKKIESHYWELFSRSSLVRSPGCARSLPVFLLAQQQGIMKSNDWLCLQHLSLITLILLPSLASEWQVHKSSTQEWNILFTCAIIHKALLSLSYPPLIHNLQVSPLQKAAHLGLSCQDGLHQLSGDLLFLLITQWHVPLLEPELALSTEQKHELHLQSYQTFERTLVKL